MIDQIVNYVLNMDPILFYSIAAFISLILLSKSSDMLVYAISDYATKLGVSDYLVGFIVVSIGTSLPELVASLNGAAINQGAIVFGTIFGSNLFKVALLGFVLIAARKIKIKKGDIGVAPIITLVVVNLPVLLVLDGRLTRIDGAILIAAFFAYVARLWKKEGELGRMKKDIAFKNIYKDGIIFILSLAVLLLSGRILVHSSIIISNILDISPYIIGIVVIGIGASMPELTVQMRSVFTHHSNLAFGNVFGTWIANSAFVLGITALISPFEMGINLLWIGIIFLIIGVVYILQLVKHKEVNWKHGVVLVGMYAVFLLLEWIV